MSQKSSPYPENPFLVSDEATGDFPSWLEIASTEDRDILLTVMRVEIDEAGHRTLQPTHLRINTVIGGTCHQDGRINELFQELATLLSHPHQRQINQRMMDELLDRPLIHPEMSEDDAADVIDKIAEGFKGLMTPLTLPGIATTGKKPRQRRRA